MNGNDSDIRLLASMKRIRAIEEAIAERYPEGEMRCPTHLSIGQEASAVGVCAALDRDDRAVSGHRAHAHYIAKGGDLPALIAELYGKATGCSGGKGGSMHLIDESVGFMGSTAIVGGTVPVGVGLGLALKLERSDRIAVVFLGDAVAEAGVFLESLSFAALKRLPVLFVCENNLFSVYSPLAVRQPEGRRIADLSAAIGVPAATCDGNDVRGVCDLAREAVALIRQGGGPRFIELATYRWREHCGPFYDDDLGYRPAGEFDAWRERDPIAQFERELTEDGRLTASLLEAMTDNIADEVATAFAFATRSAFPPVSAAGTDLYAPASAAHL